MQRCSGAERCTGAQVSFSRSVSNGRHVAVAVAAKPGLLASLHPTGGHTGRECDEAHVNGIQQRSKIARFPAGVGIMYTLPRLSTDWLLLVRTMGRWGGRGRGRRTPRPGSCVSA